LNGDGMSALAMAILFASIGMLVLPTVVVLLLALYVPGIKTSRYRSVMIAGGVALSAMIGCAWMTATFYESVWSPPPSVLLKLPPNFAHPNIIFLEKPSAPLELAWHGVDLALMTKRIEIVVPASGVITVRSLEGMSGVSPHVTTTENTTINGFSSGPGPAGLGASRYISMVLPDTSAAQDAALSRILIDPTAFAAYLREREK
jgi:hypothetical protein